MYNDNSADMIWPFALCLIAGSMIATLFTNLWILPILAILCIMCLSWSFGKALENNTETESKSENKNEPSRHGYSYRHPRRRRHSRKRRLVQR